MKRIITSIVTMIVLAGCSGSEEQREAPKPTSQVAETPGKRVYDRWCVECHGDGPRYPGTASLAVKYGGDLPADLEQRDDLTPETVALFVRKGVSIMPPFRKTEITDEELAALGKYLSHQPENTSPEIAN